MFSSSMQTKGMSPCISTFAGRGFAKFWIEPLELDYARGLRTGELARVEALIGENISHIREKWHEAFGT